MTLNEKIATLAAVGSAIGTLMIAGLEYRRSPDQTHGFPSATTLVAPTDETKRQLKGHPESEDRNTDAAYRQSVHARVPAENENTAAATPGADLGEATGQNDKARRTQPGEPASRRAELRQVRTRTESGYDYLYAAPTYGAETVRRLRAGEALRVLPASVHDWLKVVSKQGKRLGFVNAEAAREPG